MPPLLPALRCLGAAGVSLVVPLMMNDDVLYIRSVKEDHMVVVVVIMANENYELFLLLLST